MAVGIFSAQNAGTFTSRVKYAVHEVSMLKKLNENQKVQGNANLQLLQAAAQVTQAPAPSGSSGSIIDVKV